jgi:hypothetical protein
MNVLLDEFPGVFLRILQVSLSDCQELLGLETRPADQRAIDIVDGHQLSGIRGLH